MKQLFLDFLLSIAYALLYCIIIASVLIGAALLSGYNHSQDDPLRSFVEAQLSERETLTSDDLALKQTIVDLKAQLEAKRLEEARLAAEAAAAAAAEAAQSTRNVGSSYATLYIDRIGMEVPIYYGDDKATLRKGPGQYPGSKLPGEGSQILIAGHNTTHFRPLQKVVVGDVIRMVTSYGEFQYQVVDIKIASMNDTTTYNLNLDHEQLLLYTCYPFSGPPGKTQRYFVYADLIS